VEHAADATVLAAAGLRRLGIGGAPGVSFHVLGLEHMVPAVGQAAIAVQCRVADADKYRPLFDRRTYRHVTLERAFQAALGGGCQTAFAAHVTADTLWFFHHEIGLRSLPIDDAEIDAPVETATRLLKHFGFQLRTRAARRPRVPPVFPHATFPANRRARPACVVERLWRTAARPR
ncbi:MAG: hypothetical protein ABII82_11085, partial [Verrucomicrobiota bacterium]